MGVKSSIKGDSREEVKKSTESVVENPIGVDQLDKEDLTKIVLDLKSQLEALQERSMSSFDEDEDYDVLDDYLEVPAVFFCFSQEYSVHGDKRQGRESLPPLGFVKFKPVYRYARKAGRGVDVIAVSQTVVRSKAQANWIRKHSLFGIKFFENVDDVTQIDTTLAEKMAEQSARISRMSDLQIIERARQENIQVHQDMAKLRKELVQHLAEGEMKRSDRKKEEFFRADRDEYNRVVVDKTGESRDDSAYL